MRYPFKVKCECGVELFRADAVNYITHYGTWLNITKFAILRCPKCFKLHKIKNRRKTYEFDWS